MHLLLDLDNTLVDRERAFARWAEGLVTEAGGGPADLTWLLRADADGLTPRRELAALIAERLLPRTAPGDLEQRLLMEHVEHVTCDPTVLAHLRRLRGQGARLTVLTNGTGPQQRAKLERTGLAVLLDAVVISEEVGAAKPDPAIFAAALAQAPSDRDTWMIGDHPEADIRGGAAAGLRTGWVSRGRPWPHAAPPTLQAPTLAALLDLLPARAPRRTNCQ